MKSIEPSAAYSTYTRCLRIEGNALHNTSRARCADTSSVESFRAHIPSATRTSMWIRWRPTRGMRPHSRATSPGSAACHSGLNARACASSRSLAAAVDGRDRGSGPRAQRRLTHRSVWRSRKCSRALSGPYRTGCTSRIRMATCGPPSGSAGGMPDPACAVAMWDSGPRR